MDLITGGIYQGKLDHAKTKYDLGDDMIFDCTGKTEIDFSKKCINNAEEFVLQCIRNGRSAQDYFEDNKTLWKDSVIIFRDIFCGVVPVEKEMRIWRDESGKLLRYLSENADSVTRLFCGVPQKLK